MYPTYKNTGVEALKNISFEIKKGEAFAIIGKTGSGKSTILFTIEAIGSGQWANPL